MMAGLVKIAALNASIVSGRWIMTEDELKRYHAIYADIWKLFRKYSNPTDEDVFWDNLIKENQELGEKYNNSEFIIQEAKNLLAEIERIWKDEQQKS